MWSVTQTDAGTRTHNLAQAKVPLWPRATVVSEEPPMSDDITIVVGLGETGLSCARFLARAGETFMVVDSRSEPPKREQFLSDFAGVEHRFGAFDTSVLQQASRLVLSPGVSLEEPLVEAAIAQGMDVLGDIELFARAASAPVIAVTGSNGKSTVTTLLGDMARASGFDVAVGGNLGPPALDLLERSTPDVFVLELSSFQLETTQSLRPLVGAVLNISEDHMDRYADISAYAKVKSRVFNGSGAMVLNLDDPFVRAMQESERDAIGFTLGAPGDDAFGVLERDGASWIAYGQAALMNVAELPIEGMHNVANVLAALAIGSKAGFSIPSMLDAARAFTGLAHRCQHIATDDGITWFNDSKGTNVGATVAAIRGLSQRGGRMLVILGGQGKGADFAPLHDALGESACAAITFGEDAASIENALAGVVPVTRVSDLASAVTCARTLAKTGDIVLFSPACASFDMFDSYVARGDAFVQHVLDATGEHR